MLYGGFGKLVITGISISGGETVTMKFTATEQPDKPKADSKGDLRMPERVEPRTMNQFETGSPETAHRRILLAVTGLSPQVVTETVYALTQKSNPAFVPTEIHLVTTAEGAERARLTLLAESPGWFHRLREDYRLPEMAFSEETIHVLQREESEPLADIKTRDDNEKVADYLIAVIRRLTADPSAALHVSIAGGRKTMGFYAGYALSLMGRPQDRLSHVLVESPYESNQQFYYPTPYRYVIFTPPPENRPLDASKAEVHLAEIPFVRLRYGLDDRLLKGNATFSEVVSEAQSLLGPPRLLIDLDQKCVVAGGEEVHLPPVQLAFLSWLARRVQQGRPFVQSPCEGAPEQEYAVEYLAEYAHLGDDLGSATAHRLRAGMDKTFFLETKSKLNRSLKAGLGMHGWLRYGVLSDGRRPALYRVQLDATCIRWMGDFV